MKPTTREWIEKAEADLRSATREYRARNRPNFDAACFFSQQCLEKCLKARLSEADVAFPRTHDLEALLDLALPLEPLWESFRAVLADLTSYAVAFRYPGEAATREMARTAVKVAGSVSGRMRQDMGVRLVSPTTGRKPRQHAKSRLTSEVWAGGKVVRERRAGYGSKTGKKAAGKALADRKKRSTAARLGRNRQ